MIYSFNEVHHEEHSMKQSYSEFFSSVFPYIRTEYGEILRTDQKNSEYGHFWRSVGIYKICCKCL